MPVKWLNKALIELDGELEYLAQDNPNIARALYAHLRQCVSMLETFPEAGRPGRLLGTRELVLDKYPYIVPYRIKDGVVEILRVFHTSRKPPKRW